MSWLVLSVLALSAALVAASGFTGVVHAIVYAAAVSPGVLLGRRAAGGNHPGGWVAGALLGYGATQIALWLPIYLGVPSMAAFVGAWLLQAAAFVGIARRIDEPLITLSPWTRADSRALALTLLLVTVLMTLPYRNVGARDDSGTRWYRAYFTADFVWHTALTAEIAKFDSPPRNPYMASRTLHYYWTYFILPAVAAGDDVQGVLKANAMLSAVLLIAMLFLLARAAVPRAEPAAAAVVLTMLAASAEGAYVLHQIWQRGTPFAVLAETNIDAISSWQFQWLRIDGLVRGLWYNPQHSMACALALVGVLIAATSGATASRGAIWTAGVALGMATTMNPFVGALFCAVYGIAIALDSVQRAGAFRIVLRHTQAAVPVLVALAWCAINEVADGAGAAVSFGWLIGLAGNNTAAALLLSVGPILVPALAGLWPWRGLPPQPVRVAAIGAGLALLLMHTLTLSEPSWVGFRTGQILQLMVPVLLARVLWALMRLGWMAAASLAAGILIIGLPTTAIDLFNAQDIGNRKMGPGFHWTQPLTAAQQRAFEWIRRSLPATAVVQMEPVLRGYDHWSLIPSFAERRMSAGLPISLLPTPEYQTGSVEVQQIFRTADPREASQLARGRGIDYLYVDPADRAAYPEGTAKFDSAPEFFERRYHSRGISLYRVR